MIGSVKAVETKINDETRYVLIDVETGEIIDDAQGYGFRTPQKAYSAYSYRLKQNGRKTYNKKDIKKWISEDPKHAKLIKYISKSVDETVGYDIEDYLEISKVKLKSIVKDIIKTETEKLEITLPFSDTDLLNFLGY